MSKKKRVTNKHEKLDFSYSPFTLERIRPYQSQEIEPILSRLFKKNMAEHKSRYKSRLYKRYVDELVTNYIIIRNVSALEYYFRQVVSMYVDNNDVDLSKFFTDSYDFENKRKQANQQRREKGLEERTKGQFFESHFYFGDSEVVDDVFSRLLGLSFFDTVKRINKYPLRNPWPGSIGFVRNWKKFKEMFRWRNEIAHSMGFVRLSKEQLQSLCSNTLNFMEQTSVVFDPPTRLVGNTEQNYFYRVITDEKRRYSEEQERTGERTTPTNNNNNNLRPISATVDEGDDGRQK